MKLLRTVISIFLLAVVLLGILPGVAAAQGGK